MKYLGRTVKPRVVFGLRLVPAVWVFAVIVVAVAGLFVLAHRTENEFFQDLLIKLSSSVCLCVAFVKFHEKELPAGLNVRLLEVGLFAVLVATVMDDKFFKAIMVELGCGVAFFVVIEHLLQSGLQKALEDLRAKFATVKAQLDEQMRRAEIERREREEEGWPLRFPENWPLGDDTDAPFGFGVPGPSRFGGIRSGDEDEDGPSR